MSYIRSGSNPEGLYIFGNLRNSVEIYPKWGHPAWGKSIPAKTWDDFCSLYVEEFFPDELELDGLSICSEWVEDKDGRNYKTVLRYNDWELAMWDVTWFYIIRRYT